MAAFSSTRQQRTSRGRRAPDVGAAGPEDPPPHVRAPRALARRSSSSPPARGGYLALVGLPPERELSRRRDPDVGLPRPPRRARRLRAAGGLGRALRGDPRADPPPRRPADRQPPGRDEPRGGQAARRRAGPRGGARRAHGLPDPADRCSPSPRAPALGLLVAFAIRSRVPRLRWTAPTAVITAVGIGVAMVVLIPPRGEIANPQYYAHGPDIPRALEAVEAAQRTPGVLDQELDAQLVGLARLVIEPGPAPEPRRPAGDHRRLRPAQQHVRRSACCERTADDGPVFFVGDLTDRGSPLETRLVRRGRAHRRAVRVRHRQPRLRLPARASWRRRARSCSPATAA